MTVSFVDTINGSDTSNPLGTESAPRRTLPTQANHLWVRIRRGSRFDRTTQYQITAQGMIFSDYGPPEAPKPIFSALQPASSSSFMHFGDTIWANIHFDLVDRTANETAVGQNCMTFGRRGNGASPTQCVSGVLINCTYTRMGNNAINAGVLSADADYAQASPVLMVLGCDFDQLGNDAIYASVAQYLEVGYCTAKNLGTRTNSNSDFVSTIYCDPQYVWIHDNLADRHGDDRKQVMVLDVAAGRTGGLAIVERNILLSHGAAAPYPQAAVNAGINVEMRTILRNNYLRGSRLLFVAQAVTPAGCEAHDNIVDYTGSGASNAAFLLNAPGVAVRNNTFYDRTRKADAQAVAYTSTATGNTNDRNLYVGFDKAITTNSSRSFITGGKNRFVNCNQRWWDRTNNLALADGDSDLVHTGALLDLHGLPITPSRGSLTDSMDRLDRRVPDFWGRFAPAGVGYIGALLER